MAMYTLARENFNRMPASVIDKAVKIHQYGQNDSATEFYLKHNDNWPSFWSLEFLLYVEKCLHYM